MKLTKTLTRTFVSLPVVLALLAGTAAVAQTKPPAAPATPPAAPAAASAASAAPAAGKPQNCVATFGALPQNWSGQAFAIDGETLGGTGLKAPLKLWGLQAPVLRDRDKLESVAGMRARATLEDLLARSDHKVKCRAARYDAECRIVAQCALDEAQPIDLGGAMLASGVASGHELDEPLSWEPRASQRYADAEFEARKARKGLWPVWLGEK
jgi:endonuclease YncB( thermonuclease family)